jgi:hypothetical protein
MTWDRKWQWVAIGMMCFAVLVAVVYVILYYTVFNNGEKDSGSIPNRLLQQLVRKTDIMAWDDNEHVGRMQYRSVTLESIVPVTGFADAVVLLDVKSPTLVKSISLFLRAAATEVILAVIPNMMFLHTWPTVEHDVYYDFVLNPGDQLVLLASREQLGGDIYIRYLTYESSVLRLSLKMDINQALQPLLIPAECYLLRAHFVASKRVNVAKTALTPTVDEYLTLEARYDLNITDYIEVPHLSSLYLAQGNIQLPQTLLEDTTCYFSAHHSLTRGFLMMYNYAQPEQYFEEPYPGNVVLTPEQSFPLYIHLHVKVLSQQGIASTKLVER